MNQIIKLLLLLNIFCLSNFSFAQFEDELFKEIEIELNAINLQTEGIKKLEDTVIGYEDPEVVYKQNRFNWDQDRIAQMQSMPARLAGVAQGTKVFDLKKQKYLKIPKNIHVKVLAGYDEQKQTYILDKNNEIRYQVAFKDIVIIDQVTKLHARPKSYQEYKPREKTSYDKVNIFHEVSFVAYTQSADFIEKNLNIDTDAINGTGLQYQLLFDFNFPVIVGLETQYLGGVASTALGDFNITQFSAGPMVNIPIGSFNNRKIFFQLGSQFSLFHRVESTEDEKLTSFNSQFYSLGFRFYFPTALAEFVVGLKYAIEFRDPQSSDVGEFEDDVTTQDQTVLISGGFSW